MGVVRAAKALLGKVRVLGCWTTELAGREREGGEVECLGEQTGGQRKGGTFPFARLPPELQMRILRFCCDDLDSDGCDDSCDVRNGSQGAGALSEMQFQRVLSWACDARTIGYGSPEWKASCAEASSDAEATSNAESQGRAGGNT